MDGNKMDRRKLLNSIAVGTISYFVPGVVRRAAMAAAWPRRLDAGECDHRNVKIVTQEYMDEDMARRGDVVCSGEMVFYSPGVYCLDCLTRIGDI